MSKFREGFPIHEGDLPPQPHPDMQAWEVFTQLERGRPPVYAGSVDAVDAAMALHFAREHYGRDQPCVQVWVAPRAAFARTRHDVDVVWRLTDQSYRQARGYNNVRKKWELFRTREQIAAYAREDLKEAF